MTRRLVTLTLGLLLVASTAGCSGDDEPEAPTPSATPSATATSSEEPSPEPTSAVPAGRGPGDVDLTVDGERVPGDDWTATCFERDTGVGFSSTATPLSTVQLDLAADGSIASLVASGQDYGPFTVEGDAAGELDVEVTATGYEISGTARGVGEISGTLTCPE